MSLRDDLPEIIGLIGEVNEATAASKSLKAALKIVVESEELDAGWLRIHRVKGDLKITAEAGEGIPSFCFGELNAPDCICSEAFVDGKAIASENARDAFCKKKNFKTVVNVPINLDGKLAGFLFLASKEVRQVNLTELQVVARHLSQMASRLTHIVEMEKRLQTLQTVTRVGAIISSQLTLGELTQSVVEHLGKVLKTDRVNLVMYNAKEQLLEFVATFISGERKTDKPEVYPLSDGMNSWIIKNRRPLLIKEDTESECAKRKIRHGGKPAKSWLGVPMIHNGKIVGVLSVQSYSLPNLYDKTSIEMLNLVAGQIAVAAENARLYEATVRREKEKQKLYYSLTHDMLSYVTPVGGYGELIKRMDAQELLEKKDEIADAVINSANKITQFVEDILLFSKIRSGKLTLQTSAVNIYQIIDQSVSNFFSELDMRKVELYIEGEKTVQASKRFPKKLVNCDTMQIERVLNNCLQNAVKHASSRVEVTTSFKNDELYCTVYDDGDGMPKDLVQKVFDEYYQLDHGKKGVGLGLPSVKTIVEQHGGKVWVETDRGEGFAFTFTLPLYKTA